MSETTLSTDAPAADTVVDDEGYFHLPEPPDLGSTFVPAHGSPSADSAQQLPGDSCLEADSVCVDTIKSDTTVNLQFSVSASNASVGCHGNKGRSEANFDNAVKLHTWTHMPF